MAGALIALVDPNLPFGTSLMASPFAGSGIVHSGLTVSATEGAPRTEAAPLDAVAVRFEDFYAANRDELARALGLALRDGALGAEAADEAFARACQRWGQVSAYANPQGWVFRVGLNWARSWPATGPARTRTPTAAGAALCHRGPGARSGPRARSRDAQRCTPCRDRGPLLLGLVGGRDSRGVRHCGGHREEPAQPRP